MRFRSNGVMIALSSFASVEMNLLPAVTRKRDQLPPREDARRPGPHAKLMHLHALAFPSGVHHPFSSRQIVVVEIILSRPGQTFE